jgi:hypothetical protein
VCGERGRYWANYATLATVQDALGFILFYGFKLFTQLPLSQPNTGSTAVLVDELDPGGRPNGTVRSNWLRFAKQGTDVFRVFPPRAQAACRPFMDPCSKRGRAAG